MMPTAFTPSGPRSGAAPSPSAAEASPWSLDAAVVSLFRAIDTWQTGQQPHSGHGFAHAGGGGGAVAAFAQTHVSPQQRRSFASAFGASSKAANAALLASLDAFVEAAGRVIFHYNYCYAYRHGRNALCGPPIDDVRSAVTTAVDGAKGTDSPQASPSSPSSASAVPRSPRRHFDVTDRTSGALIGHSGGAISAAADRGVSTTSGRSHSGRRIAVGPPLAGVGGAATNSAAMARVSPRRGGTAAVVGGSTPLPPSPRSSIVLAAVGGTVDNGQSNTMAAGMGGLPSGMSANSRKPLGCPLPPLPLLSPLAARWEGCVQPLAQLVAEAAAAYPTALTSSSSQSSCGAAAVSSDVATQQQSDSGGGDGRRMAEGMARALQRLLLLPTAAAAMGHAIGGGGGGAVAKTGSFAVCGGGRHSSSADSIPFQTPPPRTLLDCLLLPPSPAVGTHTSAGREGAAPAAFNMATAHTVPFSLSEGVYAAFGLIRGSGWVAAAAASGKGPSYPHQQQQQQQELSLAELSNKAIADALCSLRSVAALWVCAAAAPQTPQFVNKPQIVEAHGMAVMGGVDLLGPLGEALAAAAGATMDSGGGGGGAVGLAVGRENAAAIGGGGVAPPLPIPPPPSKQSAALLRPAPEMPPMPPLPSFPFVTALGNRGGDADATVAVAASLLPSQVAATFSWAAVAMAAMSAVHLLCAAAGLARRGLRTASVGPAWGRVVLGEFSHPFSLLPSQPSSSSPQEPSLGLLSPLFIISAVTRRLARLCFADDDGNRLFSAVAGSGGGGGKRLFLLSPTAAPLLLRMLNLLQVASRDLDACRWLCCDAASGDAPRAADAPSVGTSGPSSPSPFSLAARHETFLRTLLAIIATVGRHQEEEDTGRAVGDGGSNEGDDAEGRRAGKKGGGGGVAVSLRDEQQQQQQQQRRVYTLILVAAAGVLQNMARDPDSLSVMRSKGVVEVVTACLLLPPAGLSPAVFASPPFAAAAAVEAATNSVDGQAHAASPLKSAAMSATAAAAAEGACELQVAAVKVLLNLHEGKTADRAALRDVLSSAIAAHHLREVFRGA